MFLKSPKPTSILAQDIAYDYCIVEDMKPSIKKVFCSIWLDIRIAWYHIYTWYLYKHDSN